MPGGGNYELDKISAVNTVITMILSLMNTKEYMNTKQRIYEYKKRAIERQKISPER